MTNREWRKKAQPCPDRHRNARPYPGHWLCDRYVGVRRCMEKICTRRKEWNKEDE